MTTPRTRTIQLLLRTLSGCGLLVLAAWCGAAITYSYDSANRLVGVDYGNGTTIAYSYDAAGNLLSRTVQSSGPGAPVVSGVASRRVHGAAGTFDLPLAALAANPTTEPRFGPSHTVVFTFDKPVTSGSAGVTEGTAINGVPTFSGNEMRVPLTGVANQQYVTVTIGNVAAADGGTGGGGAVRIGYLAGDVSQDRVVSAVDIAQVNAQIAKFVGASNYLKDVNASGTLTVADKGLTNTMLNRALPAP